MRTSFMMVGELGYSDVFLGMEGADPNSQDKHGDQVYYRGFTYFMFVIFFILATIIIMNLLVGLAVYDIKIIQEKAELKQLGLKVNLVLDVELILPKRFRRRFHKENDTLTVKTDQTNNSGKIQKNNRIWIKLWILLKRILQRIRKFIFGDYKAKLMKQLELIKFDKHGRPCPPVISITGGNIQQEILKENRIEKIESIVVELKAAEDKRNSNSQENESLKDQINRMEGTLKQLMNLMNAQAISCTKDDSEAQGVSSKDKDDTSADDD